MPVFNTVFFGQGEQGTSGRGIDHICFIDFEYAFRIVWWSLLHGFFCIGFFFDGGRFRVNIDGWYAGESIFLILFIGGCIRRAVRPFLFAQGNEGKGLQIVIFNILYELLGVAGVGGIASFFNPICPGPVIFGIDLEKEGIAGASISKNLNDPCKSQPPWHKP